MNKDVRSSLTRETAELLRGWGRKEGEGGSLVTRYCEEGGGGAEDIFS